MITMTILADILQTGTNSHMASSSSNQQTILIVTVLLGLIVLALIAVIIIFLYLFYTGRLSFARGHNEQPKVESKNITETEERQVTEDMLPPVSLTPLEKKIIQAVIAGHNVLQSDLPNLVNSSKSKVSEALGQLEEKKLVQRYKAGRSLTVKYIYQAPN